MPEEEDKARAAKVEFQMALASLITELQKLGVTKKNMEQAKEALKSRFKAE